MMEKPFFSPEKNQEDLKLASEFINLMASFGAKPSAENKAKLIELLTSDRIVNYDRQQFITLFEIDYNDKALIRRLEQNRKQIMEKYNQLLKIQLVTPEFKEMLTSADLNLIESEKVEVCNTTIYTSQLNDSELADLGIEQIRQIIKDILEEDQSTADQGYFWNVIISRKLPYVLKLEIQVDEDSYRKKYLRKTVYEYAVIKEILGRENLPSQVVMQHKDSDKMYILQEKIDLDKMTMLREGNIDDFLAGRYGQELKKALEDEKNQRKLKEFIERVEKLFEEKNLMVDFIGANMFIAIDDQGNLDIKVVDYGCFEKKYEHASDDIKKSIKFLEKLKQVVK